MPNFRVTIRKPLGLFSGDHQIRNPFEPIDPFSTTIRHRYHERVWEPMEAENEEAIRAFFREAQASGNPQVVGFEIAAIERIH